MSPDEADTPESRSAPPKPRRIGKLWLIVVAMLVVLVLALVIAYLARRDLARNALDGWLEERGIASQIEIESFGPTGAIARIRAGDLKDPEFTVERAEIDYGLLGLWSGDPFVEVRRVRLVRPIVRGAWRDGKLSFGALDPLIEEFSKRPPRPDARRPLILIEDGLIGLDTEYGLARLRGDARIENNKLMTLEARLSPVAAKAGGVNLAVRGGEISLKTRGDRVAFSVGAILGEARGEALAVDESFLRLTGEGPYPDLEKRRGDGALALTLTGGARRFEWGGSRLGGSEFTARFHGRTTGWLDSLAVGGRGTLEARAETGSAAGAAVRRVSVEAEAPTLAWTRTGADRLNAQGRLSARIGELLQDDLRLRDVAANFRGSAEGGAEQAARVHLTGGASARGAWTGLGTVEPQDDPGIAALKRTLGSFELRAPAVSVDHQSSAGLTVALGAPARLIGAGGGELALSPRAGGAVFERGGGAFVLKAAGGGLPQAEFAVDRYTAGPGGFVAQGRGRLEGDFLLFRDAELPLSGVLRARNGAISVTSRGCTPVRAGRLELGENDLEDVTGRFCATSAPMLTLDDGAWRVRGEIRDGAARAPFLELQFTEAAGVLDVGGRDQALTLKAGLQTARVVDTVDPLRFHPVRIQGQTEAAGGVWNGRFDLTTLAGLSLGQAVLRHEDATQSGSFQLDTGQLVFSPEGLQPADLSPTAVLIASPAEGEARFVGGFTWAPQREASGGTLTVSGLDFRGPIGMVRGLSTQIELDSLAPLVTAPEQVVRAERVEAFALLTDLVATGKVEGEALHLASASATAGRGRIELEPMTVPFEPKADWGGAMRLDDVQLSDLIEASPLAEQMDLVAKVDGRVPFQVDAKGVRVAGGEIHAVEPGRLSIQREALTSVAAEGGAPEEEPNLTVDFAYQAMENLAFSRLAAEIESRPGGRLGVLFHIDGEHDPPRRQELRLSYWDLIGRSFLNRSLPLPSGVEVDLTLDMSLNLDQLLADWGEYQRLIEGRGDGSATVQPDSATSASDSSPGGQP